MHPPKHLLHSALLSSPQPCSTKQPATRSLNCPRAGSLLCCSCCTAISSCRLFSWLMDRCLLKPFASSSAFLVFSMVQGRCELPQQFPRGSPHLDGVLGDTSVLSSLLPEEAITATVQVEVPPLHTCRHIPPQPFRD